MLSDYSQTNRGVLQASGRSGCGCGLRRCVRARRARLRPACVPSTSDAGRRTRGLRLRALRTLSARRHKAQAAGKALQAPLLKTLPKRLRTSAGLRSPRCARPAQPESSSVRSRVQRGGFQRLRPYGPCRAHPGQNVQGRRRPLRLSLPVVLAGHPRSAPRVQEPPSDTEVCRDPTEDPERQATTTTSPFSSLRGLSPGQNHRQLRCSTPTSTLQYRSAQ